jgi:predicted branched-subunit amino acid permease
LVVGVISDQKGLSWLETLLMSALVFAGSSQLLALELWSEPAPILAAIIAAIVVNIRMAPMGAALAPWLDKLRGAKLWGSLAFMVDHAFALSAAEQRRGGRDAGFLLGIGVTLWCFSNISVSLGHSLGSAVRFPAGHPLYFAAIATFLNVKRDCLDMLSGNR